MVWTNGSKKLSHLHSKMHPALITPWFLQNIKEIIDMEDALVKAGSLKALVA